MKNMTTMLIEMPIPFDMDPSDLLARMQELALEFAEEFPREDFNGDEIELDQSDKDEIENEVSVSEKPAKQTPAGLASILL
jgi:hypothetical protein